MLIDDNKKCNVLHFPAQNQDALLVQSLVLKYSLLWMDLTSPFIQNWNLEKMLCRKVPLQILTDSKCLFDAITKGSTHCEKHLLVDIVVAEEIHDNQEITQAGHVLQILILRMQ